MVPVARGFALALVLLGLIAGPASADTTFTVNSTSDAADIAPGNGRCEGPSAAAPGPCTLRAAVMEANALAGTDTIVLSSTKYALTRAQVSEPDASAGDLDITQPVTIRGPGARNTVIQNQSNDRVFEVAAGVSGVTFEGITITGGAPTSGTGAGLLTNGSATLERAAVRDQRTTLPGAGDAHVINPALTHSLSLSAPY
jgi:CSLREA domain-containing protein